MREHNITPYGFAVQILKNNAKKPRERDGR